MTIRVCFVGDDAHPPWNHASSILTKRLIECLSGREVECSLATSKGSNSWGHELVDVEKLFARTSGRPSLDAVRLSIASRTINPDILHLVGTNALVFSPVSKALGSKARIVRHIFTPYDSKDRAVGPLRAVANRLFIDCYAFTTPRIGRWENEVGGKTRRFIFRPPINTEFYQPREGGMLAEDSKSPIVLYMGPLMPTRFPKEIVLRAMKRLKERGMKARLVVLTSASRSSMDECNKLVSMSREMSLSDDVLVERIDLSETQRIRWYNTADIVLFPYLGPDPEKLADPPFGILEAMSCGSVVLATDVLSVSDVVQDGTNGFLMKRMTVEDLEAGLERALQSIGSSVGSNARAKILRTFDYGIVSQDIKKAYSILVG